MTTTEQKRLRELANGCARNVQDALRVQAAILAAIEPYRAALEQVRHLVAGGRAAGCQDAHGDDDCGYGHALHAIASLLREPSGNGYHGAELPR